MTPLFSCSSQSSEGTLECLIGFKNYHVIWLALKLSGTELADRKLVVTRVLAAAEDEQLSGKLSWLPTIFAKFF